MTLVFILNADKLTTHSQVSPPSRCHWISVATNWVRRCDYSRGERAPSTQAAAPECVVRAPRIRRVAGRRRRRLHWAPWLLCRSVGCSDNPLSTHAKSSKHRKRRDGGGGYSQIKKPFPIHQWGKCRGVQKMQIKWKIMRCEWPEWEWMVYLCFWDPHWLTLLSLEQLSQFAVPWVGATRQPDGAGEHVAPQLFQLLTLLE